MHCTNSQPAQHSVHLPVLPLFLALGSTEYKQWSRPCCWTPGPAHQNKAHVVEAQLPSHRYSFRHESFALELQISAHHLQGEEGNVLPVPGLFATSRGFLSCPNHYPAAVSTGKFSGRPSQALAVASVVDLKEYLKQVVPLGLRVHCNPCQGIWMESDERV